MSDAPPPAAALLAWYDRHRRRMPWRALPGAVADPYHVWLSEVMLQQTTVAVVHGYFTRFLLRFPTVAALAAAPVEEVLSAWAGLGYYARARNLHECARAVAGLGGFPRDAAALRALPGIGAYTATAIAAIAFGVPGVPVDGNVERVAARVAAIEAPLPAARPQVRAAAEVLGEDPAARARPADFAQALFDLGATICTPATPACGLCPWRDPCRARSLGLAADLPRKAPKPARPARFGAHFWLTDADGQVLLRRRPAQGLLGGMLELPGTAWRAKPFAEAEALDAAPLAAPPAAPLAAAWRRLGAVRHGFTHFTLTLDVYAGTLAWGERGNEAVPGLWRPIGALAGEALPSVMRKCVALAGAG